METTATPLRQQLDDHLNRLTPDQQVLALVQELLAPPGQQPWWERLPLIISPEDAELMRQASADCRPIEPDTTPSL